MAKLTCHSYLIKNYHHHRLFPSTTGRFSPPISTFVSNLRVTNSFTWTTNHIFKYKGREGTTLLLEGESYIFNPDL